MNRIILCLLFIFALFSVGERTAYCKFSVDWGTSTDPGPYKKGYKQIAEWLVDNGYYSNERNARSFARTGYIGHDRTGPDPFYWQVSDPVQFQIVEEHAGYADLNVLGYYTGSGCRKTLTEIFGGTENGPKVLSISQPFGLYLRTPECNTWYTDRSRNKQQKGLLRCLEGYRPQALIYELRPGTEWLVAWEDLDASRRCSDRDYNDMYVKISVNHSAPEPMSAGLFFAGGGLLSAISKRKKLLIRKKEA